MWRKDFDSKHLQLIEWTVLVVIALFFAGIFTNHLVPYVAAGLLTAHVVTSKRFDQMMLKQFKLENPRRTIRLFPGDETDWEITLVNSTPFPLIHGEIICNVGDRVKVLNQQSNEEKYWRHITVPASIMPRRKTELRVPVKGMSRGTARISKLAVHFPHLFNFQQAVLQYVPSYDTEFIVYPKLERVEGLESVFHARLGDSRVMHSPFEDLLEPIGTRDYTIDDSFQRINWKASVRAQELQVNIYQHVVDRSFIFLVNVKQDVKTGSSETVERLLSQAAYLCKYATGEGQSYELMLNAFRPGNLPFVHQHEGNGNNQLVESLELLARIPRHTIIHPFEGVLYYLIKTGNLPRIIVILGEITEEAKGQLNQLVHKGHHIFRVEEQGGVGVIVPWKIEHVA